MEQTGMFWHVHHDVLVEYCHSYDERKEFILVLKDKFEHELRLKLMQPVKGELPKAYAEASKACAEACKAYAEASKAYVEAKKAYEEEINTLHTKECPDCPWDGKTIFTESEAKNE